jgi:MFS family permease
LYVAVFMTTTQVPFLLRDDGVGDPAVQSWVLAMSALWNAIGAGCYGRLRTVVGAQRTLAFALAFMAGGHVALGLSHHAIESAVGCAITGIGTGLVVPHVPNAVLARVDGAARGRALGLMVTALYFGSFCSPLLVAPVASGLGRHAAFLVSGALLLLVTLPLLARAGIRSAVAIGRT